jgi:mannose-6-phosphate isomerase-like protein (cupin superfamily)
MSKGFVAIACVLGSALLAGAQPAPPQQPTAKPSTPPAQGAPAPRRPAQPTVTKLKVGDFSGQPLGDVSVQISGTETTDARTDGNGVAALRLKAGSYRLRFTHDDFITLERDITVRAGRPEEITVTLSRAPAPPPAPQPVPPPPPPPVPTVDPAIPTGSPANVSIPTFLDKNLIGREPLKESVVGCTADATTRVLQLRDSIAPHVHPDLDEVLYIVAGTGAVRIGDQATDVAAGSLSVIPRGQRHAIERKGRNPLIVLSTLAGAPCQAATLARP